jgi:hypothetical protein
MSGKWMKKTSIAALCIVILCVTGTVMIQAQSTTQGAIGGTVFDPTNRQCEGDDTKYRDQRSAGADF